jgi:redox-sensitive bicupin YhaK (pirin superfamily)
MQVSVEIRRGTNRFISRDVGIFTRHSFSFAEHYDPDNLRFGRLVCHDDHRLAARAGFGDHPHRDLDIVTWVISGSLVHSDSAGHDGVVRPGSVQMLSAGSGVTHSEFAGPEGPARFVQAWLTPIESGLPPHYSITPVDLQPGALTVAVELGDATLRVARLDAGESVRLPDDRLQHVFVVGGALARSSLAEPVADGDAFRITDQPGLALTAAVPTELVVWTFPWPH